MIVGTLGLPSWVDPHTTRAEIDNSNYRTQQNDCQAGIVL